MASDSQRMRHVLGTVMLTARHWRKPVSTMTTRLVALFGIVLLLLGACGGAYTPRPVFTPVLFIVFGQVGDSQTGHGIAGATVDILDGPNAGRSTVTRGDGFYRIPNLTAGGITLRVRMTSYADARRAVMVTEDRWVDFRLTSLPK